MLLSSKSNVNSVKLFISGPFYPCPRAALSYRLKKRDSTPPLSLSPSLDQKKQERRLCIGPPPPLLSRTPAAALQPAALVALQPALQLLSSPPLLVSMTPCSCSLACRRLGAAVAPPRHPRPRRPVGNEGVEGRGEEGATHPSRGRSWPPSAPPVRR